MTVEPDDGDPLEGATVAIEGDEVQDEGETQADGTALFEDIAPGQYAIEATAENYGTATAGVDLEAGENEEIALTLPEAEGEEVQQEGGSDDNQ